MNWKNVSLNPWLGATWCQNIGNGSAGFSLNKLSCFEILKQVPHCVCNRYEGGWRLGKGKSLITKPMQHQSCHRACVLAGLWQFCSLVHDPRAPCKGCLWLMSTEMWAERKAWHVAEVPSALVTWRRVASAFGLTPCQGNNQGSGCLAFPCKVNYTKLWVSEICKCSNEL